MNQSMDISSKDPQRTKRRATRMARFGSVLLPALLPTILGLQPSRTFAQQLDTRELKPIVVLMVDTSGSMGYIGGVQARTGGLAPTCTAGTYTPTGLYTGASTGTRWLQLVAALTGQFTVNTFPCLTDRRNYANEPDQFYNVLPSTVLPLQAGTLYNGAPIGSAATPLPQQPDGILDIWRDRVKFALMTFDNTFGVRNAATSMPTYALESVSTRPNPTEMLTMVPERFRTDALSAFATSNGDYSYGSFTRFEFPSCTDTYIVNAGARRPLVSPEFFPGAMMRPASDTADLATANLDIQTALLRTRPFGATPTAGMLDDLLEYTRTDPEFRSDCYVTGKCRQVIGILLTDGRPTDPFREAGCEGVTAATLRNSFAPPLPSGNGVYDQPTSHPGCPFRRAKDAARELCNYDSLQGKCTGALDKLYVLGIQIPAVGSPESLAEQAALGMPQQAGVELNDIAAAGGTTAMRPVADYRSMVDELSAILTLAASGTRTRTVPSFVSTSGLFDPGNSKPVGQYQITSGFYPSTWTDTVNTAPQQRNPWFGILDRQRFECSANSAAAPALIPLDDARDRFHVILNNRTAPRNLFTYASPSNTPTTGALVAPLASSAVVLPAGALQLAQPPMTTMGSAESRLLKPGGSAAQTLAVLRTGTLNPGIFGITGGTSTDRNNRVDAVVNYMNGVVAPRIGYRLGDIYHSSPVPVPPPRVDMNDERYNDYRAYWTKCSTPGGNCRPSVLYVSSNDGILHAFALESYTNRTGDLVDEGTEMWGFVPPVLLPRLESAMTAHQELFDSTVVVKDMFYYRASTTFPGYTPPPGGYLGASEVSQPSYRTLLLAGMREGGKHYFLLDVTDPQAAEFRWQWTHPDMGKTYGRGALAQVLIETSGSQFQTRGVAILPGGTGLIDSAAATAAGAAGCVMPPGYLKPPIASPATGVRAHRRCWTGNQGRGISVVDLASGALIRSFGFGTAADGVFSPITGSVSLFPGDVGSTTTHAYVTDADGVLWRLDMSNQLPSGWTFKPVHDLFWNGNGTDGQPSHEPPVISVDDNSKAVILVGTGNLDDLESSARHRVVSISDPFTYTTAGDTPTYAPKLNWEIVLRAGESVTSPLELFDGIAYFSTFSSDGLPPPSAGVCSAANGALACSFGTSRVWAVHYLYTVSSTSPVRYIAAPALDSAIYGGVVHPQPGFPTPSTTDADNLAIYNINGELNAIIMGLGVTQRPTCIATQTVSDAVFGSRAVVTDVRPGAFALVYQTSGGANPSTTAVQTTSVGLPTPPSITRFAGWAPVADFR